MLGSSSTIRIFAISLISAANVSDANDLRCLRQCRFVPRPHSHRQIDGELAAPPRHAIYQNLSAMRLHNVAHQGKTQTAALGVMNQRIAHPIKLVENLLLLSRGNADAMVYHFQLDRTVVAEQIYADILLVLRILERVVHQVQQGTRHGFAIDAERRYVLGDLFLESKSALLDLVAIGFE